MMYRQKGKCDDGTKHGIIQPIHNLMQESVEGNNCYINS